MEMNRFSKEVTDWYAALIGAKARAKLNGRGYAFAVQWPTGRCTVEDDKPMLRQPGMRVIDCDCSGAEYLA
jgi:hypothetical protein